MTRIKSIFLASLAVLLSPMAANAVLIELTYDDLGDQTIGTDNIVGTGTFSFDGSAIVGFYALSSLTNMAFSASFDSGETFNTSDIMTDLDFTGIFIYDAGSGRFGLLFTGNGGRSGGGSLDLQNDLGQILTHEPSSAINDPIGCCGGDGMVNLYAMGEYFGDYQGLTAVPEPGTLALLGIGLFGMGLARRKKV